MQVEKQIVTISEMARMLSLSRARFYQLLGEGVLPAPSRNPQTHRPFYTREQQEQCLLVKKTNCGINGKPVLFYGRRQAIKSPAAPKKSPKKPAAPPLVIEIQEGLKQLGVTNAEVEEIKAFLKQRSLNNHGETKSDLLMSAFRHLKCQNSKDNVAR